MKNNFNKHQSDNRVTDNFITHKMLWVLLPVLKWLFPSIPKTSMRVLFFRVSSLWSDNGKVFLVKYLKECYRLMQHYIAGHPQLSSIDIAVGLNGGIPSIIPGDLRLLIKRRDPVVVRFILTVFSLYRVVKIPGTLKLNSITDPFKGLCPTLPKVDLAIALNNFLLLGNVRSVVLKPLDLSEIVKSGAAGPNNRSSLAGLYSDVIAWCRNPELKKDLITLGSKIPGGQAWLARIFKEDISEVELFSLYEDPSKYNNDLYLGRLAIKEEAAGKMRVFAITDLVTQTILRPLHSALFSILRTIPMDGTFDQKRPLIRLLERKRLGLIKGNFYSYDLSSATDRLPIQIQKDILSNMFSDEDFGESWGNLLTRRDWVLTSNEGENLHLKYSVGQPMGALSSWAMLAITHHVIVQYAAHEVGELNFVDYALLGDDIVIASDLVANKYYQVMTEVLGVEINTFKSLISSDSFEFAKRLISVDHEFSPLSPANLVISLKSINGIASLILDALNKGWDLNEDWVDARIKSVPNVSPKHLDKIIWSIKGPFGFIPTREGLSANLLPDNSLSVVRTASFIYNTRSIYFKWAVCEWESNLKRSVNALLSLNLLTDDLRLEHISELLRESYSKEWIKLIRSKPVYALESWSGPHLFHIKFHSEVVFREYVMARVISILRNTNFSSKSLLEPLSKRTVQSFFSDKSKKFFDEVLKEMRKD